MLPEAPSEPEEDPVFYVHPDNWRAFKVFQSCHTQWRMLTAGTGLIYQGLDYPSVLAVIHALAVKKPKRTFRQVQLIEIGALSEINDRQDLSDNTAN